MTEEEEKVKRCRELFYIKWFLVFLAAFYVALVLT